MTTTYTVQAGDNLSRIAREHNMSLDQLAKLNNISNPDNIKVGTKLIFDEEQALVKEDENLGFDTFERVTVQEPANKATEESTYTPLLYGAAGVALWQGGKYAMPKVISLAEDVQLRYLYGKDAAQKYVKGAVGKSKQTATAVRNFIAQKAKHVAKSAELHYAFGKDAVQKGVKSAVEKGTAAAKHAAKSAELHYAFGKDAVQKGVKKAAQKGKSIARYTRFVGNTKVAPTLIKGASKFAGPAAAVYGMYEVVQAYKNGGEKAAVKQAVKTGSGLAGGWAGAKVGAAIGSFAGPIGTVAGGIIGGIAGYLLGEKLAS